MNKYEKLTTIGEGAYGVVLKARHKETDEIVAIKKFKEREGDDDEQNRKASVREVKILKAMKHANIVEMKEAFRRRGTLYVVFEYMDKSVLDLLEANPKGLEPETVRILIFQLASALEHCHRQNVIHRDIKPENLLVNQSDYGLRLCDFGCARRLDNKSPLTDYVATRWYRPPELLLCSNSYNTSVDLWGLGCIMGELTDGKPLFPGESDADQLCVIQRMIGPLTAEQLQMRMEMSCFGQVQFPDGAAPQTLEKRYAGSMSPPQMELMKGVLAIDPASRTTAKAAARLPWLKGVPLPASLPQRAGLDPEPVASKDAEPAHAKLVAKAQRKAKRITASAVAAGMNLDGVFGPETPVAAATPAVSAAKLPTPGRRPSLDRAGSLPSMGGIGVAGPAALDLAMLTFGSSNASNTPFGKAALGSKPVFGRRDASGPPTGRPLRPAQSNPGSPGATKQGGKPKAQLPANGLYVLPWEEPGDMPDDEFILSDQGSRGDQPAALLGTTGGFGEKAAAHGALGLGMLNGALGGAEGGAAAKGAANMRLGGDRRTKRWSCA